MCVWGGGGVQPFVVTVGVVVDQNGFRCHRHVAFDKHVAVSIQCLQRCADAMGMK